MKKLIAEIEANYQRVTYGYDEPNRLLCNRKMAIKLSDGLLLSCKENEKLRFNNATLIEDETLPDNVFILENSKYPREHELATRFNIVFEVEE